MKQKIKRMSFLLLYSLVSSLGYAYSYHFQPDFEVDGIYYMIVNSYDRTVAVSYKEWLWEKPSYDYSGKVVIPSTVRYNGTNYSVTEIDEYAFYRCESLTSVEIPFSITKIGKYAFSLSGLTEIEIPNSIKEIDEMAFRHCAGLKKIEIPSSVKTIYFNILEYCPNLDSITVDVSNPNYDSRDDCNAIIEKSTGALISGCKNSSIPFGVRSIGEGAFLGCTGLRHIDIPSSVISIESHAFEETGLISADIPDNVKELGSNTFYLCKSLTKISFGSGITYIGSHTCSDCISLVSVTIPNSVTGIGASAFYY